MILRALYDLAHRERLDLFYEPLAVDYLIHLGPKGRFIKVTNQSITPPSVPGRRGASPEPPKRPVPRRSARTSKTQAEFLVDKAEYVFGVDPKRARGADALVDRKEAFASAVDNALADPLLAAATGLEAVRAFLAAPMPSELKVLLEPKSPAERQAMASAWFAFVYEPDGGVSCVHDDPVVRGYFERHVTGDNVAGEGQCLVTGRSDARLSQLHASPKGIPPRSVTKGGVPLTSVNKDSFKSYGLDSMGCAPISTEATLAIDAALSRLLDDAYCDAAGRVLPKRNVRLTDDTTMLYWAKESAGLDFLQELDAGDPEKVAEMLRSPYAGRPAVLEDPSAFYALILSGTRGRAIVRSFVETTVRDVAANVSRHLEAARIDRPHDRGRGAYGLVEMRRALAVATRTEPRGDVGRLAPGIAASMFLAVLTGRPYPRALLDGAVRRNRAEALRGRRATTLERLAARCSLLKAYFIRSHSKEVSVSLDAQRPDPSYRLGRLLAALDKVQQEALGSVNATLVDRYFGSASSTPAAVFPALLRRTQHHISKLRSGKPGLAVVRERLVQDIVSGLDRFPRTMSLDDQGLFAIGFYHQRQDLFTKKEE